MFPEPMRSKMLIHYHYSSQSLQRKRDHTIPTMTLVVEKSAAYWQALE